MKISIDDNPYGEVIRQFVQTEWPSQGREVEDVLEALTAEIIGSKQSRYGPMPGPESLVEIRKVLAGKISANLPINFILPWGSEKPDGSGPDIAELGALRVLACLQKRVVSHYAPGAIFSLALEDLSAPHLMYERADQARIDAAAYVASMRALVKIMNIDSFVFVDAESGTGVSEERFNTLANNILPAMLEHLRDVSRLDKFGSLASFGWDKPLKMETISHYLTQYNRLYPNESMAFKLEHLARYFSGALARSQLGLRGRDANRIELFFGKPIPGITSRFAKRIHYRTLPLEYTSNHISPWRAKGYLEIGNDNSITPKLASFGEALSLVDNTLHLSGHECETTLRADYCLV